MPEKPHNIRFENGKFSYRNGRWWPWWAILILPFLILFIPLYRFARNEVNWKAAWLTVLTFEILLLFAEHDSLQRGHWVYNEARILGPKVWGIPIEEPLLYYLFPPLIIISILHAVRKKIAQREDKGAP